MENYPKIFVSSVIIKDDMMLLGKRKNSCGEGTWFMPCAPLEFADNPEDCAVREALKQTRLIVENPRFWAYTNDIFDQSQHYITLYVIMDYFGAFKDISDNDKFENWSWFYWDSLPQPLFFPLDNLAKQISIETSQSTLSF